MREGPLNKTIISKLKKTKKEIYIYILNKDLTDPPKIKKKTVHLTRSHKPQIKPPKNMKDHQMASKDPPRDLILPNIKIISFKNSSIINIQPKINALYII